ncbi:FAD-dependent oxidoreductase [Mesorhizobium sp. RMAD-H1]|uniref:FAD-dependent oxidoreductase n=1 Tax=Mesorhizobium sp. RMAD-H1 TaxID=2587065 RepID=UPI00181CE18D|nr:2-polyprenyl-6-methoxyphenol hydroxylase-like FAD-dependent oxidoreductase [Mesorhizobium sp. RMAD-H1]
MARAVPSSELAASLVETGCCIAGGGPAGLMLGYLLARAGIDVVVLEKHEDFLRDFRGDTIHPSTLEIMNQLGLLEEFLQLPHQKARKLHAEVGGRSVTIADFSRLPCEAKFIAFMPQWDFLDFLARKAGGFPNFRLILGAEITDLLHENGAVKGVFVRNGDQSFMVRADLVVGADGRNSIIRQKAAMEVRSFGTPTDVLWMKLSHLPGDPVQAMGHVGPKQGFVMIDRGDYWQCGYIIRKQSFEELKAQGLSHFRQLLAEASPFPRERFGEIASWGQVHLLSVRVDRLKRWWAPGVLCIGDAAHAMSPIGGVGVNLAIQDAVAAANILAVPLKEGRLAPGHLAKVQRRRSFPTWATQSLQLMMRRRRRGNDAGAAGPAQTSGVMQKIARRPWLAHVAGRLIGLGFRPERVKLPQRP